MAEIVKDTESSQDKKNPSYDPSKTYQWKPGDKFIFDGIEFAKLYQALKTEVYNIGGAPHKQLTDAFQVLEDAITSAVAAGVAIEITPPSPQQKPIDEPLLNGVLGKLKEN